MKIEDVVRMVKYPALNRTAAEEDEARGIILDALEKQVPKEVGADEFGWNECPNHCTLSGLISSKHNYCPYCGQRLKWKERNTYGAGCHGPEYR